MWDDRKYELVVQGRPFGLVWDIPEPPARIYGRPSSEASFPFIICRNYEIKKTPGKGKQTDSTGRTLYQRVHPDVRYNMRFHWLIGGQGKARCYGTMDR